VNGGDGCHAHPTQALLDLYTVRERLGSLEGLKVAIVGDVLHSRVARSNCWGFTTLGARVVLCGPPTLMPLTWRDRVGLGNGAEIEIEYDLARALDGADIVMALRLQRERQAGGLLPSIREYCRLYGITAERMRLAKPHALVMHPGPMNEGVEISPEVAYGTQSVIEDQVTNGVAIRMALLYLLAAGRDADLEEVA
jgi:aspartate carbamoyltransferase catalytic subunit